VTLYKQLFDANPGQIVASRTGFEKSYKRSKMGRKLAIPPVYIEQIFWQGKSKLSQIQKAPLTYASNQKCIYTWGQKRNFYHRKNRRLSPGRGRKKLNRTKVEKRFGAEKSGG